MKWAAVRTKNFIKVLSVKRDAHKNFGGNNSSHTTQPNARPTRCLVTKQRYYTCLVLSIETFALATVRGEFVPCSFVRCWTLTRPRSVCVVAIILLILPACVVQSWSSNVAFHVVQELVRQPLANLCTNSHVMRYYVLNGSHWLDLIYSLQDLIERTTLRIPIW